jgi:hypothetical protein
VSDICRGGSRAARARSPVRVGAVDEGEYTVEIVACPECGAPAEVEAWSTLPSTGGPVEHVRTTCLARHRFLLPRDMLAVADAAELREIPSAEQL